MSTVPLRRRVCGRMCRHAPAGTPSSKRAGRRDRAHHCGCFPVRRARAASMCGPTMRPAHSCRDLWRQQRVCGRTRRHAPASTSSSKRAGCRDCTYHCGCFPIRRALADSVYGPTMRRAHSCRDPWRHLRGRGHPRAAPLDLWVFVHFGGSLGTVLRRLHRRRWLQGLRLCMQH